ncbi:DNA-processing protein DprA [Campylobacter sp. LR291e]|uniref:DNA-processing protein DprA n=1 Tax=unclassified Campylobacter TaxID=2593542 RepID=UPI001238E8D8|nr:MULTISPECIES: DNA-processing protein DprA [unclassified Campylobacter]KAA6229476.1 DNA-processing protein DprA [Campylobacter sp. LR264d]KAA6230721.1 DNA-processing protein DprA [Campylobacter sp. LR291e]
MSSLKLDKSYLKLFNNLENPPKELFYKGNLSLLNMPKVAIIGSRKMSVYTKNCVLELASLLKNVGVCVVSGGALGVDIIASKAAMPNTIGIFANGLNKIYPKNNEYIIKEIYEKGLALSENYDNYTPKPYDFLLRNRLIIALSQMIIIAQADLISGSMQSARMAIRINKPLFVLPQRIYESKGTNALLSENKASLIADFTDFASKFGKVENKNTDELLEFCKKGVSLEQALAKFGQRVYEYELEGKIQIDGVFIRVIN